jgi:uncharacterized membrane protein
MSSAKEKDYFGSFLAAADGSASSAPAQGAAAPAEAGAERHILALLAAEKGSVSVKDLIARLEIPPSLCLKILHQLSEARLVEMRAVGGDECVAITDLGRRIAA